MTAEHFITLEKILFIISSSYSRPFENWTPGWFEISWHSLSIQLRGFKSRISHTGVHKFKLSSIRRMASGTREDLIHVAMEAA